jgi:hypothetical protein
MIEIHICRLFFRADFENYGILWICLIVFNAPPLIQHICALVRVGDLG